MQDGNIYRFYPNIGIQNINIRKLNQNFDALNRDIICINIDEDSVITPGSKGFVYIPSSIKITGWVVGAYCPSSLVVDVRKATPQSYPASVSITGTNKICLAGSACDESNMLSGWDYYIQEGNWIEFVVENCVGTSRADVILKVSR